MKRFEGASSSSADVDGSGGGAGRGWSGSSSNAGLSLPVLNWAGCCRNMFKRRFVEAATLDGEGEEEGVSSCPTSTTASCCSQTRSQSSSRPLPSRTRPCPLPPKALLLPPPRRARWTIARIDGTFPASSEPGLWTGRREYSRINGIQKGS